MNIFKIIYKWQKKENKRNKKEKQNQNTKEKRKEKNRNKNLKMGRSFATKGVCDASLPRCNGRQIGLPNSGESV